MQGEKRESDLKGDDAGGIGRWLILWSSRQRVVLAGVVLVLCGVIFVRAARNPMRVGDPVEPLGARAGELATRIDPNTANWAAWAALPLIGEKRAREIVAWREKWMVEHPGEVAFGTLADLKRVRGIGDATCKTLEPFLVFPKGGVEEKE